MEMYDLVVVDVLRFIFSYYGKDLKWVLDLSEWEDVNEIGLDELDRFGLFYF